jgi:hypothetical protein
MVYSTKPEPDVAGRDVSLHRRRAKDDALSALLSENENMTAVEFWDRLIHIDGCGHDGTRYGRPLRLVLDGDRYRVAHPPMVPWSADWDEIAGLI